MTDDGAIVAAGRAAWSRLRRATSWADWLAVGEAIRIGRTEVMCATGTNRPVGSKYNRAMGQWIRDNGFASITAYERYKILLCLENLDAIEKWRATLNEERRRKYNHPNSIWSAYRKDMNIPPKTSGECVASDSPRRQTSDGSARAIFWPQDCIRRAATAMRESRSQDWFVLARIGLEAAIRNTDDFAEVIEGATPRRLKAGAIRYAPERGNQSCAPACP